MRSPTLGQGVNAGLESCSVLDQVCFRGRSGMLFTQDHYAAIFTPSEAPRDCRH